MSTRRRRMRYQPSKAQCIFTGIIGIFFCLIGLFMALPNFGLFGLVWTGIAVVITVNSFAMAAGKKNMMGSYVIDEEEISSDQASGQSVEDRLRELQNLYDKRLITTEEYEAKRQEILKEL